MNYYQKLKKYGIVGSVRMVLRKCAKCVNTMLYYFFRIFPIKSNLILMESEGDLSDNTYALYDYMKGHGYLEKYRVVWLVNDLQRAKQHTFFNTSFEQKTPVRIEIKRSFYMATCRWFIYDHCNILEPFYTRKNCQIINLWHGCAFKADKGVKGRQKSMPEAIMFTGQLYLEPQMAAFGCTEQCLHDLGYPRNDYLFLENSVQQKKLVKALKLDEFQTVLLWMPTFRKCDNPYLSEDYFASLTGLPILYTLDDLMEFNDFLKENNSLCLFKVHHLQANSNVFQKKFSNIVVLKDEEIQKYGLQLYQVIPLTDCLITDYSSIANDYMLLNRPMIYTVDDYDEYRKSRGFVPDDPIEYFAGDCVRDKENLIAAVQRVVEGEDIYREKREQLMPLMHTHPDGHASERILEFLSIKL